MRVALSVALLILIAAPALAQESVTQVIPPGCSSVTTPATPTVAGKVVVTCPQLTITTPLSLPKATANSPYSVNLAALANPKGGWCPAGFQNCYTYALNPTNPVPPTWLNLSAAGMVTGKPTAQGTVNFSFTVTDKGATLAQAGQASFNMRSTDAQ